MSALFAGSGSPDRPLPASIEISPKQALAFEDLPGAFPRGVRVYLTDLGLDEAGAVVAAAKRLEDAGYAAVPHIAARRLSSKTRLEDRVIALTQEAGVRDVLVVGGPSVRAGDFSHAMDVLETGLLDKYGITRLGVAGHPEGSRDFSDEVAMEALDLKAAFAERTGAEMRIVTQFGFNGNKFVDWAVGLNESGVDLPVHLGVAGPTKIGSLMKYAAQCGVGSSVGFLTRRAPSLAALTLGYSPESVVKPIERRLRTARSLIEQIHVFPFGGVKETVSWLKGRGSWLEL